LRGRSRIQPRSRKSGSSARGRNGATCADSACCAGSETSCAPSSSKEAGTKTAEVCRLRHDRRGRGHGSGRLGPSVDVAWHQVQSPGRRFAGLTVGFVISLYEVDAWNANAPWARTAVDLFAAAGGIGRGRRPTLPAEEFFTYVYSRAAPPRRYRPRKRRKARVLTIGCLMFGGIRCLSCGTFGRSADRRARRPGYGCRPGYAGEPRTNRRHLSEG
jgi:hypothetical protein